MRPNPVGIAPEKAPDETSSEQEGQEYTTEEPAADGTGGTALPAVRGVVKQCFLADEDWVGADVSKPAAVQPFTVASRVSDIHPPVQLGDRSSPTRATMATTTASGSPASTCGATPR